ncbi:MAG: dgkA [Bacteroidetes bacterium]|jgi:diacylglycerol kinase (ATP)|nr:dgkA [Bacteroidota bacterium]MDF2453109.1 dgkA [Bacteroidota bacterium]
MISFFRSFGFAFKGINFSLMQRNMKIMLICAFLAVILGFILHITSMEWCVILICIGLVLALETMNTAIEAFVDLVQPNHHPVAGKIKDLSAGAVFIFCLLAFACGVLIFGKYILDLLSII